MRKIADYWGHGIYGLNVHWIFREYAEFMPVRGEEYLNVEI